MGVMTTGEGSEAARVRSGRRMALEDALPLSARQFFEYFDASLESSISTLTVCRAILASSCTARCSTQASTGAQAVMLVGKRLAYRPRSIASGIAQSQSIFHAVPRSAIEDNALLLRSNARQHDMHARYAFDEGTLSVYALAQLLIGCSR